MKRLRIMTAVVMTLSALFFGCDTGGDEDTTVKVTSVTISGSDVENNAATIAVGGDLQLTATVLPNNATNKTVTWSSSDTAKATVSATGLVHGEAAGSADITATAEGKSATVTITVNAPAKVTDVVIKKDGTVVTGSVLLAINGTVTLTAEVSPTNTTEADRVVTWISSDEEVATIANGVVTGVAIGTATITATTAGLKADGTTHATATATISVTEAVKVESVVIKKDGTAVTEFALLLDGTVTLTAEVLPTNTTEADRVVTWTSSDEEVATIANGVVTGVAIGSATITATTAGLKEDSNPATATVTISVTEPVKVASVVIKKDGTAVTESVLLPVNGTVALTAEVSPDNTTEADRVITWTSDAPAIATVADGVVTWHAGGTATITATTAGFKEDGTTHATASVTITAETVKVTEVVIKKDGTAVTGPVLLAINGTVTLTAEVSPANTIEADKVVTWTSDAPAIATVANGVVTWVAEGTATITATTAGLKADGKPATASVTVTAQGTPKLVIFNQTGTLEGTTAAGDVTDADFNATGRLTVKNTSTTSGWGTTLDKIAGDTFVYLDTPLQAPFSVSARVKITQLVASSGTDNGVLIGAFTDPTVDNSTPDATDPSTFIALAGVNIATSGRRSVYATRSSDNTNSATSSTQFIESVTNEYVYTVTQATVGTYNIKVEDDAFDPTRPHTPYTSTGINRTGDAAIHSVLGRAAAGDVPEINDPLYLGFLISGVEAEISNIIIKQGDTTVYSKPAPATPYPPVQSVTITNEAGASVEVGGNLQMTASVSPEGAYQGVTWEIDPEDVQYAEIDPTSGALKGLDIGSAKVYAVSVDNGAGGTPVRSGAFTVTIIGSQELPNSRSWNFQEIPAGWTDGASNNTTVTYTQGMNLLGSIRTSTFNSSFTAPADSGLSNGFIQPGGTAANGFVSIASVQGPFNITLKYVANASDENGRYPTLKIGEEGKGSIEPSTTADSEWKTYWDSVEAVENTTGGSTGTSDPKSFTHNYTGTDKVDILLLSTMNPGRLFDVIIEYTGQ
ncbi:MAG: Ig-like domain-containing protein [Treponema sp.]|jgi:uncharacterized protein YjdB|nr:Ig-like domain-containing protein [Treponema sp.]